MADLSVLLYQHFEVCRRQQQAGDASTSAHTHALNAQGCVRTHSEVASSVAPFLEALNTIRSNFISAKKLSRATIRSALETMDETVVGTTQDIEATLSDAKAQLIALSSSVAALSDSIKTTQDKVASALNSLRDVDDDNEEDVGQGDTEKAVVQWFKSTATSLAGKGMAFLSAHTARNQKSRQEAASLPSALKHFAAAAAAVEQLVSAEKLRIGLCEEELEQYHRDLWFSGRCGVLDAHPLSQQGLSTTSTGEVPNLKSPTLGSLASKGAQTVSRISTAELRNAAMNKLSSLIGNKAKSQRSESDPAASDVHRSKQLHHAAAMPSAFDMSEFSEAERDALQARHTELALVLQESSAVAAKEVEASVRELSHLTSLLSENAVLQAEQLASVAKNADEAHRNIDKVREELKKPGKSSLWLNPTRQMILLLWVSSLLLLIAHFVVR